MAALTWWGWLGLAAGAAVAAAAVLLAFGFAWQKRVRLALVDHLRATAPGVEIVAVRRDRLELRFPDRDPEATGTFDLERFYARMSVLGPGSGPDVQAARTAVRDAAVAAIRDGATGLDALDPAVERDRVFPRIVQDDHLAALRAHVAPAGKALPALPSGVPGLSIVFVLDRQAAVAYLTEDLLADLGLTAAQALDAGRANLARTFGRDVVRAAVGLPNVNVIKIGDSFDAARLLLVPGYLDAGESLVALIPDRDTLVLTAPPADGQWAGLRRLAGHADGDPLCANPLIVTPAGIARAA